MVTNEKISNLQLGFLITVFTLGDFLIINPSKAAMQDAWLAILIALFGGYVLLGIYLGIYLLNPSQTLIEILRKYFGKFIGSIIGIMYVWYFIHIGSVVLRTISEYMVIANYPETPLFFITIIIALPMLYVLRKGLEVLVRLSELVIPLMYLVFITFTFLTISLHDISNLHPFLEKGIGPVLKVSFGVVTFPFGEIVVFLMIFPYLNDKEKIVRTTCISIGIVGISLALLTFRELAVLGPQIFIKTNFPPQTVASLVPNIIIEPFVAINKLLGGFFQTSVWMFGATLATTQLLGLDDMKPLITPFMAIIVPLSIWIYHDFSDLIRIAAEIYPYYALFFQVVIPTILLLISIVKRKRLAKSPE